MEKLIEIKNLNAGYSRQKSTMFSEKIFLPVNRIRRVFKQTAIMKKLSSEKNETGVIRNLDLTIYKGETLGLLGESGCGKSTLAKVLTGLVNKASGDLIFHCERPFMVFQDPYSSLNPGKRIRWILSEPLRIKKASKEEIKEQIEEMIIRVGLDESYLERFPHQLSGGQRQRIAIAQALLLKTELLILDEPVSALDVTVQSEILKLLMQIKKDEALTMLFITHDVKIALSLCDRIAVLKEGRIVEQKSAKELFQKPEQEYTVRLLKDSGIER